MTLNQQKPTLYYGDTSDDEEISGFSLKLDKLSWKTITGLCEDRSYLFFSGISLGLSLRPCYEHSTREEYIQVKLKTCSKLKFIGKSQLDKDVPKNVFSLYSSYKRTKRRSNAYAKARLDIEKFWYGNQDFNNEEI